MSLLADCHFTRDPLNRRIVAISNAKLRFNAAPPMSLVKSERASERRSADERERESEPRGFRVFQADPLNLRVFDNNSKWIIIARRQKYLAFCAHDRCCGVVCIDNREGIERRERKAGRERERGYVGRSSDVRKMESGLMECRFHLDHERPSSLLFRVVLHHLGRVPRVRPSLPPPLPRVSVCAPGRQALARRP